MNAVTPQSTNMLIKASAAERFVGHLALLRPANLVTSCGDVLAGWVIVGAPDSSLFWRLSASVGLYAGGVALNDFCDRNIDGVEHPERPIPSGLVPARNAAILGTGLLTGAVLCGFRASPPTGILCLLIVVVVLAYDAGLKHRASGLILMGSCRALNLMVGLIAAPSVLSTVWYLPLLPLLYVCGITLLSRDEVSGGKRKTVQVAIALQTGAIVALAALSGTGIIRLATVLPFVGLLFLKVGVPLWQAHRLPRAVQIQRAVHAGVLSLIVLDAALAASYAGLVRGAAILSLALLASELSKVFAVT